MSTSDSPGPVHHDPARNHASTSSPSADSPEVPSSPGPPPGSIPGQHDDVVEPRTHGRHAEREAERRTGAVAETPDEPKSPGPTPGTVPGNT